jgi:hypothetical protein
VFGLADKSSSLNVFKAPGTTAPQKVDPFATTGFMRIFFGADGMAIDGLRYDGSIKLRQDFGPAAGSTASSGGSANSFNSVVFVRREFSYVASDKFGTFRFGQADGPIGLFDNGITTF